MVTFFLDTKDRSAFLEYLRINGLPTAKPIGETQFDKSSANDYTIRITGYQQFRMDIKTHDLTALKMMFNIKRSLF